MNVVVLDFSIIESFLYPLNVWTVSLAVILGIGFGAATCRVNGMCPRRILFWQIAAALVFFVPYSLFRELQGSPDWARILGTGTLWIIFVICRSLGGWIYEHVIDGVPRIGDL
jgi:hypothetical protein